ncbi:hypothetical protein [Caballeronia sordidicola]|uniref:hypothetical protein n=1 Tax=Caballeronia sordidicola TaxID=196367 RepID=UPI0004D00AAD|nr:hypothetical protein [Caballeronia sordidicola]
MNLNSPTARRILMTDIPRVVIALLLGWLLVRIAVPIARGLGEPEFAPWITFMGGGFWAAGLSHVLRRLFFHRIDMHAFASKALEAPTGAGLVFLGVCLVLAAFVLMQGAAIRT